MLTEGDPKQIANDPQVKAVYLGHGGESDDLPLELPTPVPLGVGRGEGNRTPSSLTAP